MLRPLSTLYLVLALAGLICGVEIASLPNDDGCTGSMPVAAMVAITGSGVVDCAPEGGTPTGAVTVVNQITVCCAE